jgi:hypothetical protein
MQDQARKSCHRQKICMVVIEILASIQEINNEKLFFFVTGEEAK